MGHLVSSGFSRHGFGPDQGCAGRGMVAPFRPASRRPSIDVVATSGPLTWGTRGEVAPAFLKPIGCIDDQRGACHRARIIAPQPCIRQVHGRALTMMQSCAWAAKLRGGGPILENGIDTMACFG